MLPLTTPLLAALLGQACPTPSAWDPPPCAAARVPGCLPGYRPQYDRLGRLFYVCDIKYAQRPAETAPPPPRASVQSQVPPSPQPAPQASVSPTAPAITAAPSPPPPESRGHVGLVLMPGVAAFPNYRGFDGTKPEGQVALEFRGSEGGARIRLTGEYASFGKIGELSFKYDFLDGFFFRPWLAIGLGVASINPDPAVRAQASASGGVDLYISRDFFLTGELKGRIFTEGTEGPAHGLAISDRRQISLLAGMGFYFF